MGRFSKRDHLVRRSSRMLLWVFAWIVILSVCVVAAFLTKASYTDYTSDQDAFMALRYWHGLYSTEGIKTQRQMLAEHGADTKYLDPDTLIDETETIVECEFTGERTYSYLAFVSQVHVVHVLKGDKNLEDTTMPVYEPMGIWVPDDDDVRSKYPTQVEETYKLGTTMMTPSKPYVLFLEKRTYPQSEDRTGKPDEYVLCESPFAKLSVESKAAPETPVSVKSTMTLAESLSYEILAKDTASAKDFFDTRNELLQKLGVK